MRCTVKAWMTFLRLRGVSMTFIKSNNYFGLKRMKEEAILSSSISRESIEICKRALPKTHNSNRHSSAMEKVIKSLLKPVL